MPWAQFSLRTALDVWLADSGASRHIIFRKDWLIDYRPSHGETVCLGDNGICDAKGTGKVMIDKFVNGKWIRGVIENVFYVPNLRKNLFSVGVCTSKGYEVQFKGHSVIVYANNKVMAFGEKQDNDIYRMFFRTITSFQTNSNEFNLVVADLKTWHERLGCV